MFTYSAFTALDLILLSVVSTGLLFIAGANAYLTTTERRGFFHPTAPRSSRLPSIPPPAHSPA